MAVMKCFLVLLLPVLFSTISDELVASNKKTEPSWTGVSPSEQLTEGKAVRVTMIQLLLARASYILALGSFHTHQYTGMHKMSVFSHRGRGRGIGNVFIILIYAETMFLLEHTRAILAFECVTGNNHKCVYCI